MTPHVRSPRELVVLGGSFALVATLPLIAVFAHRGYAPMAIGMALLAMARRGHWKGLASRLSPVRSPVSALTFAFTAFSLWIAVSEWWSPTPGAHWLALSTLFFGLAGYAMVAEALVLDDRSVRLVAAAFATASFLALLFLFFEACTDGYLRLALPPADASPGRFRDITGLGRGLAAVIPGLFPAAVAAALLAAERGVERRFLLGGLAAVFLVGFFAALELTIAANSAAILAAAAASAAAFWRPRATIAALTFVFFLGLAIVPALAWTPADLVVRDVAGALPLSWLQRLYIWRDAAREAFSCLPLGCGADYARALAAPRETFMVPGSTELVLRMPTHPHNVFLQIWLELGLPGVALAAIAILAGGRLLYAAALTRPAAAAIAGAAGATLVYWCVEASFWQAWRLGSVVMAAAAAALVARLAGKTPS